MVASVKSSLEHNIVEVEPVGLHVDLWIGNDHQTVFVDRMPIVIFVQVNSVTLKLQSEVAHDLNHFAVEFFRRSNKLHNTY